MAWQLTEAGYSVELDVWDWAAGRNFVIAMSDALERCDRLVALFSTEYFDRARYTTEEWTAAALHVPGAEQGRLVPVRVEEVPAAQRCAAALTPEGRPRTLARRVPRPQRGSPCGEGERRRSRLLLVLGRAAAGPRSRGVLSRQ